MPTGEELPKGEGQEERSEEDERSSERRAIQCHLQKAGLFGRVSDSRGGRP